MFSAHFFNEKKMKQEKSKWFKSYNFKRIR